MPEPYSPDPRRLADKSALYRALYRLAASRAHELREVLGALYHRDAAWRGSHPLN